MSCVVFFEGGNNDRQGFSVRMKGCKREIWTIAS